jgi:hypothetical protein
VLGFLVNVLNREGLGDLGRDGRLSPNFFWLPKFSVRFLYFGM